MTNIDSGEEDLTRREIEDAAVRLQRKLDYMDEVDVLLPKALKGDLDSMVQLSNVYAELDHISDFRKWKRKAGRRKLLMDIFRIKPKTSR